MALLEGQIPPGFLADDEANGIVIPIPPPHGGALRWDSVYVSFGCDFGDVTLRIAVYNDRLGDWRGPVNVLVPRKGGRVNIDIQDGDAKVSVGRVKGGASDTGKHPAGWLLETSLQA